MLAFVSRTPTYPLPSHIVDGKNPLFLLPGSLGRLCNPFSFRKNKHEQARKMLEGKKEAVKSQVRRRSKTREESGKQGRGNDCIL